jgi:hypothetical protein
MQRLINAAARFHSQTLLPFEMVNQVQQQFGELHLKFETNIVFE